MQKDPKGQKPPTSSHNNKMGENKLVLARLCYVLSKSQLDRVYSHWVNF